VLVETQKMGRTEHFTPVQLAVPAEAGVIIDVRMAGHDGRSLLAA
jgi:threonylcarbamoyladenosine tRNA methylthiotransferase MtaB